MKRTTSRTSGPTIADPAGRRAVPPAEGLEWLVLFYQLPARHSPARVKAWRRLQRIGAVTLKNSAYVVPNSAEAREDLEWIKAEINAIGGQAMVMAADAVDPSTRQEVVELFRVARGQDFQAIHGQAHAMLGRVRARAPVGSARRRLMQSVRRLRERFHDLEAVDFFDAPHHNEAAQVLADLDRRTKGGGSMAIRPTPSTTTLDVNSFRGRVWLTRPRPGVDRMSSAWLIRRFIDPDATFAFGDAPGQDTMIRFDMFGAEFGHRGTACTFETIAQQFGLADPAVAWLGRMVHDLDLKEDTYAAPEKAAVGRMVEGFRRMYPDDQTLLSEGIAMFEALYQSYRDHEAVPATSARSRQRRKPQRDRPKAGRADERAVHEHAGLAVSASGPRRASSTHSDPVSESVHCARRGAWRGAHRVVCMRMAERQRRPCLD
jgi:hypothetical protein